LFRNKLPQFLCLKWIWNIKTGHILLHEKTTSCRWFAINYSYWSSICDL